MLIDGARTYEQEIREMSITMRTTLLATLAATMTMGATLQAHARINCSGAYQVVRGQGQIATPYCEDQYLARVARGYGMRVSGAAIRRNPSRKEEVCRLIGHDGRVTSICHNYRLDSCRGFKC